MLGLVYFVKVVSSSGLWFNSILFGWIVIDIVSVLKPSDVIIRLSSEVDLFSKNLVSLGVKYSLIESSERPCLLAVSSTKSTKSRTCLIHFVTSCSFD